MLKLTCQIELHHKDTKKILKFQIVHSVEIVTSMDTLTDTAKVGLPRRLRFGGQNLNDFMKRGDLITIKLGYNDVLETVFEGYLKNVSTGTPITLECENEAWKLKQTKVTAKHYPKFSVKSFVDENMKGYKTEITDTELGEVRISGDTTLAKVFDYLKSHYPVRFFFRDGVFYGLLNSSKMLANDAVRTVKFKEGTNQISNNLKYTLAEDVNVQVVTKVILKDNKKMEWKEPKDKEENMEVRTYLCPSAKTSKDLETEAKARLAEFKADKMSGDFLAFGEPFVRKGDIVHLYSDRSKEMNDKKFLVQAVTYTFGLQGYRQKITLGTQIK